jgi:hypothetical protein
MNVPGGVADAWVGPDPTNKSSGTVTFDGDHVEARWLAGYVGALEIFVVPTSPVEDVTHALTVTLHTGPKPEDVQVLTVPDDHAPGLSIVRTPLLRGHASMRSVSLTFAVAVTPPKGGTVLSGSDPALNELLQQIGYMVGPDAPASGSASPSDAPKTP